VQDFLAEGFNFAVGYHLETTRRLQPEAEAADAGE